MSSAGFEYMRRFFHAFHCRPLCYCLRFARFLNAVLVCLVTQQVETQSRESAAFSHLSRPREDLYPQSLLQLFFPPS